MIEKMEVYFSQRLTMLALSLQYTSNILSANYSESD